MDVIANVHTFSSAVGTNAFDMILTIATYEHMSRPWIATKEIASTLNPGGWLYIRTHQTFPLHGHPQDFFRFSTEALSLLCEDAGLKALETAYEYPVSIVSFLHPKGSVAPAYMHVESLAEKP